MTAVQALLKLQTSCHERGPVWLGSLGLGREAPEPRSSGPFEYQRGGVAADVSQLAGHQGGVMPIDLSWPGRTPDLFDRLENVVHAVQVPFGKEAPRRVYR